MKQKISLSSNLLNAIISFTGGAFSFIYLSKHKTLKQLPALRRTAEKLIQKLSSMSILEISGFSTSRCFLNILKWTFLMIVNGPRALSNYHF